MQGLIDKGVSYRSMNKVGIRNHGSSSQILVPCVTRRRFTKTNYKGNFSHPSQCQLRAGLRDLNTLELLIPCATVLSGVRLVSIDRGDFSFYLCFPNKFLLPGSRESEDAQASLGRGEASGIFRPI